jgi:hypothetical protein
MQVLFLQLADLQIQHLLLLAFPEHHLGEDLSGAIENRMALFEILHKDTISH